MEMADEIQMFPFFPLLSFNVLFQTLMIKKQGELQEFIWKLTQRSSSFHAKQWPILISKRMGFFLCMYAVHANFAIKIWNGEIL